MNFRANKYENETDNDGSVRIQPVMCEDVRKTNTQKESLHVK